MRSIEPNRAGRTIKHSNGYNAFHPVFLVADGPPELTFDAELWRLLSEADRALGELNGITKTLYSPDLFVGYYVKKEALLSSQIEGTQCSLDEVLQADEDTGEIEPVYEVVNYVGAMNYGLDRLRELPFSLRLLKEIHGILLRGVRGKEKNPGEFKKYQNWIGPAGGNLNEAIFVPPPPEDTVAYMGDLETYYHQEPTLPVLIKAAILHAQFETIHPFSDGNGRLGRLLITFFLCANQILDRPLLYLSLFFKEHRTEYYNLLTEVRTQGAWERWIKFFLRGVRETSLAAGTTARELVELREKHRQDITAKLPRLEYAHRIYDVVNENPIIAIAQVSREYEIPFPTVMRTALALAKIRVLSVSDEKYGKTMRFDECLEILKRGTD